MTIPNSVTSIGYDAFGGNPRYPSVVKGYRENGEVGIDVNPYAYIVLRNWTSTTPLS